jgi:hypothetical protein
VFPLLSKNFQTFNQQSQLGLMLPYELIVAGEMFLDNTRRLLFLPIVMLP